MAEAIDERAEVQQLAGGSEGGVSVGRIVGAVGLFAVGFVLVAALLHTMVSSPLYLHADVRSEKLEMLAQMHDSVYSATFGSSHVHNGFSPVAFDHELDTGAGPHVRTQTMNLAILGGSQAEQRTMALNFVEQLPQPPAGMTCLVLLELNAGANFQNNFMVHPRTIDVYDWKTVRFIDTLTSPQMPRTQRIGRTGYAVVAAGLHYINLGMLANRIFSPPLDQTTMHDQTVDDRRGQDVLQPQKAGSQELPQMLAAMPKSMKPDVQMMTPGNAGLIDELEAASTVRNLQFVYFVYPKLSNLSGPLEYPDQLDVHGRKVPIINLARPDLYPWIYDPKYWHDDAHLDETGSKLVSAVLADRLKAWYAANGAPPTCGGR